MTRVATTLRRVSILLALLGAFIMLVAVPASANGNGQDTCPKGDGWVKYDDLDGLTFTIPEEDIPEGYVVTENCFKAANTLVFGTGPTVTNETVVNQNGKLQDISHASFLLVQVTTTSGPTTTEATTTTVEDTTTTTVDETTTTTEEETTTRPENPTTTVNSPTTTSPARTASTQPEELPFTGIPMGLGVGAGALSVLAGVGALLASRRSK